MKSKNADTIDPALHLVNFQPCTVDLIDSSPESSGNIGYRELHEITSLNGYGRMTYRKRPCDNLGTCPATFLSLGKEFHISMGKVWPVVTVKDKNTWLDLFIILCWRQDKFAGLEQGIMLGMVEDEI